MGTNGTDIAAHLALEEEKFAIEGIDRNHDQAGNTPAQSDNDDFRFGPLVDKIAFDIAKGLVGAVKELEHHIAIETRKVGDAVERRLDSLHNGSQELARFVGEQISANGAVQDQLQQLTAASDSLREGDARQAAELEALRNEARDFSATVFNRFDATAADLAALGGEARASCQSLAERIDSLCRDFGLQQEDIAVTKTTLSAICSRVDAFVERLDRQGDAVRSLHSAYSHRETELEQIVDGLARMRAYPMPLPVDGL